MQALTEIADFLGLFPRLRVDWHVPPTMQLQNQSAPDFRSEKLLYFEPISPEDSQIKTAVVQYPDYVLDFGHAVRGFIWVRVRALWLRYRNLIPLDLLVKRTARNA